MIVVEWILGSYRGQAGNVKGVILLIGRLGAWKSALGLILAVRGVSRGVSGERGGGNLRWRGLGG